MVAEDETPCRPEPSYNFATDRIEGLCGPAISDHKCDNTHFIEVGDPADDRGDDTAFNRIVHGIRESVFATYVSIIVIVPLTKKLPNVIVYAQATCNRFAATPHVASKWDEVCDMFDEVVSSTLPLDLTGMQRERWELSSGFDLIEAHVRCPFTTRGIYARSERGFATSQRCRSRTTKACSRVSLAYMRKTPSTKRRESTAQ